LVLHLMTFKGGNVHCKEVDMITNHSPMHNPFRMICNVDNLNTVMDKYEPWLSLMFEYVSTCDVGKEL
jgi:hypothetical protein